MEAYLADMAVSVEAVGASVSAVVVDGIAIVVVVADVVVNS